MSINQFFVLVLIAKTVIVSWLVILALIIGFIFKYKQAKTAQQIAEEAERQKRKNEREKKLLSRSLSRGRSSILKDKKSGEKKGTEDSPIKGGESAEKAEGQAQLQPTDGDGRSEEKYLKKIADLEKRAKEEKDKRSKLKRRVRGLTDEKANAELRVEEEKKRREELEQQLKVEAQSWEERLDTAFKDKCMEEGKCVELKKRVDEEKARNEELEKRNVEYAVLLEGERRKVRDSLFLLCFLAPDAK